MKRKWATGLLLLAAAAVGGCGAQELLLGTQGSYLFTAMDVLCLPGREVDLRAQLRGGDFLRGRAGYAVRFFRDGKLFKVAETDDEGIASVAFTPASPGDYAFRAELVPVGLAEDPPAPLDLRVACRKADAPIAVVDLDRTVVATGFETVLVGSPGPMARSQEVLQRLARTHTVVYLTHRPDYFSHKSKVWLGKHGYPAGPLLLSTPGGFLKGSGAFKSEVLARLGEQFRKIEIGIGDKVSDARAYHDHGLRSFLIVQVPEAAAPEVYEALADELASLDEKVQVVTDWDQVDKALFGKAALPRSAMQKRLNALAKAARVKQRAAKK